MWAGAGGGSSLGPEWVSVSGTGRRPSRVRLLNEEWTERPVCRGDRRPLGPSRAYPPAFPSSRTSAQADRTALSPHLVPALSPPGAPFGDFLHQGRALEDPSPLLPWVGGGVQEKGRGPRALLLSEEAGLPLLSVGPGGACAPAGPCQSLGTPAASLRDLQQFPSASFCGAVLAPRPCVPVSPLPPGCRGPHEP